MDEDNDSSRLNPHLPQQEMARAVTSGSEVWSIAAVSGSEVWDIAAARDSSITEPELGSLSTAGMCATATRTEGVDQRKSIFSSIDLMDFRPNLLLRARPVPLKFHQVVENALTVTSKMSLEQAKRNTTIFELLRKLSELLTLMDQHQRLEDNSSMKALYRRVTESAHFINVYLETPGTGSDALISGHIMVLECLMQHIRDQVPQRIVDDPDFSKSKCCLPGTRKDIVSEIKSWIGSTGADMPRVTWLSGTAGKGKSAIAHTIADWYRESRGLGTCYYYDCTSSTDLCHVKFFTTIARDLGDCDSVMRQELTHEVDDDRVQHAKHNSRPWEGLILMLFGLSWNSVKTTTLIVIDGIDEISDASSRTEILRLLAGKVDTIPSRIIELSTKFHILITSRPLEDIHDALHCAPHVRHVSIDDIPPQSTEHDIQLYISKRLANLSGVDDAHFQTLTLKSGGLFEWARLACDRITNTTAVRWESLFEAVTSAKGIPLLDDVYMRILADVMPQYKHHETIATFHSVMAQIIASLKPLPMMALFSMRELFPRENNSYDVRLVLRLLGSLIVGTTEPQTPVRPLHASFYDFLTDKSRSQDFFVDISVIQSDLAFASLRVMQRGLRSNICDLDSSYLPNADLEQRVNDCIVPELSYSCRFWATHVQATTFELSLAEEVEAFFDPQRPVFWLEVLALVGCLDEAVESLSSIADWLTGRAQYLRISDTLKTIQHSVQTIKTASLQTSMHVYLSTLSLAPMQSRSPIAKFPFSPYINIHVKKSLKAGRARHMHAGIMTVAISPDGKLIVCGSYDGTIQLWNAKTGETEGAPFGGHTGAVRCIVISSDGKRIVSGSNDKTVQVWDMEGGKASFAPLLRHTHYVLSVAISPNGNRIVSGSADKTIQIWDATTGKALGDPLKGHTDDVWSVAITPDGKHIVSGSEDETIRIWLVETGGSLCAPLRRHTGAVLSVAVTQGGTRVVSGSSDKTIRRWDAATGESFGKPLLGHTGDVRSVATSPDGRYIVSASDGTMLVWDSATVTGQPLGSLVHEQDGYVRSIAISLDGQRIVSSSSDGTIRVWDLQLLDDYVSKSV